MQWKNITNSKIEYFIETLKKSIKIECHLSEEEKRYEKDRKIHKKNPDMPYINNIKKEKFPVFEIIKEEKLYLNKEILFLGFLWNVESRLFDSERLLIPLYFSFYLEKPVYIFIEPRYFKVDYLDGITKILDEKLIPSFEIIISRASYLNNYKKSSNTKDIIIAPIQDLKQKCDFMYPNSFLFKSPDPSFTMGYKNNIDNSNNIIVISGRIYDYKGQIFFLKNVNVDTIKDYTILIIGCDGRIGQPENYTLNDCIKVAKKRNISIICIPALHHKYLNNIIPKCKYQISLCSSGKFDANPRSITEGLFAGLPFLVSDTTILPDVIQNNFKIGLVCKSDDVSDFNEKLKKLLTLKNKDVIDFVEKNCNYNMICRYIMENVINKYKELIKF